MRVFLAGAGGAIGRPLLPRLIEAGHEVTGLSRSEERAEAIRAAGAEALRLRRLRRRGPGAGSRGRRARGRRPRDDLASRPDRPAQPRVRPQQPDPPRGHPQPARRRRGGRGAAGGRPEHLLHVRAGRRHGQGRGGAPDERRAGLLRGVGRGHRQPRGPGDRNAEGIEGLVLRYGWFYGPGTYFGLDGSTAEDVRRRRFPIVGKGSGVSSFIHIDDAAAATVAAVERGDPGIYNVVDDEPAPMSEWIPVYAEAIGAKRPAGSRPGWPGWSPASRRWRWRPACAARRTRRQRRASAGSPPTRAGARASARAFPEPVADLGRASKRVLLSELREHSLVIGEVVLSGGDRASYYVDARRALLRPAGFRAAGELIAAAASRGGSEGGRRPGDGGDPARLRGDRRPRGRRPGRLLRPQGAQGARPAALGRGRRRARRPLPGGRGHGHHRRLDRGRDRADPEQGLEIAAVLSVVDRLAGGGEAIEAAAEAPYRSLVTIDEIYPDRPDR